MNTKIHTHHRLGSGRVITTGQMVRAVRLVRSQPLNTYYRETFTGYDGTGRDILRAFGDYCQAEINRRGALGIRKDTPATFDRQCRRLHAHARPSDCKRCGTSVGRYVPDGRAFCDASCYTSYHS